MTTSFNPLELLDEKLLTEVVRQRVRNIIRSYNNPTDLLAEPIQNAVDEIEESVRTKAIDRGRLKVDIDCSTGKISVSDNGRGMSVEYIKRSLAPDVTNKVDLFMNNRSRGHKGVGLTFLAYGFNFFELESRTGSEHYKVRMENARQWVETSTIKDPPEAQITRLEDDQGILRESGTVITIQVSDQTEPRNLSRSFSSAEYAKTVLETQTAAGVYPRAGKGRSDFFDAQLTYHSKNNDLESLSLSTSYRFPHEVLPRGNKAFDLGNYLDGNPSVTPPVRHLKKYDSVYRFYSTDTLARLISGRSFDGDLLTDSADIEGLLRRHKVTAYALAGSSAGYKDLLSKSWHIPRNRRVIAPSIRVATDSMISSWQRDLSLTHRGFNVERIWIVVHLVGVEPDLGRKDYPPQILELLAAIENPLADNIALEGGVFLIPATRSGKPVDYDKPDLKAVERRKKMFPKVSLSGFDDVTYVTEPQEEQDVIALFNELRGLGILRFFRPVFFSGSYVYDSYLQYDPQLVPDIIKTVLPGQDTAVPNRLRDGVAEFKYRAADIMSDLVRSTKDFSEITWLICWTANPGSLTQGGMILDIIEVEAGEDPYAGVTHAATLDSTGEKMIHIVALKTLLERLGKTQGR